MNLPGDLLGRAVLPLQNERSCDEEMGRLDRRADDFPNLAQRKRNSGGRVVYSSLAFAKAHRIFPSCLPVEPDASAGASLAPRAQLLPTRAQRVRGTRQASLSQSS